MNCELYEIRKQLDDLQKRLELYEKANVCNAGCEHDSILNSVEKMRGIRNQDREQNKEVD